jgi:hypothetical protein
MIDLYLSKKNYHLGDKVEGYALVRCDDDFECNRVVVYINGFEKTEFMNGEYIRYERNQLIRAKVELIGKTVFRIGETRFDFYFDIPEDIPGTYYGIYGMIKYEIKAVVEISLAFNCVDFQELTIKPLPPKAGSEALPISVYIQEEETRFIEVELLTAYVKKDDILPFTFRVYPEAKINGVNFELIHHEVVASEGHHTTSHLIWNNRYIKETEFERNSWIESEIKASTRWAVSIQSKLILSRFTLKISLDFPWRFDKSIEVPITVHY